MLSIIIPIRLAQLNMEHRLKKLFSTKEGVKSDGLLAEATLETLHVQTVKEN